MTDDPEDHSFSEGQGFDDPYDAFDIDPPEFEVDPDQVDPVDSRVVTDMLSVATFQIGYPVVVFILMKTNDRLFQHARNYSLMIVFKSSR
jgi:hypothetical protein